MGGHRYYVIEKNLGNSDTRMTEVVKITTLIAFIYHYYKTIFFIIFGYSIIYYFNLSIPDAGALLFKYGKKRIYI